MIRLVSLYGVGDCYLICALHRFFEEWHKETATVVLKRSHAVIAQMFGVPFEIDDATVARGENDAALHSSYSNSIGYGGVIYVHPHFVKTPTRLDQLTIKPRVSQADMYRALLSLPPWAPLTRPNQLATQRTNHGHDVLLIPKARSWPNLPIQFWTDLQADLIKNARIATFVDETWTLEQLLAACFNTRWLIGAQCGVMSVVIESGWVPPARKTLAITELGPDCAYLFGLTESMPYGHCSTFAGNDHADVEHVVVPRKDWSGAIREIQLRAVR
jgi:hypothetical protein